MGDGGSVVMMFHRSGEECVAHFGMEEAHIVRQCVAEVAALLSDGFDHTDPAVGRLFPDAYRDDPTESEEFRRYTEADLKSGKLDQVSTVLAALPAGGGEVRLDGESADAWLRALTDVRLALGVRLDVREDTDLQGELDEAVMHDPTSARVGQLSVYGYLSMLQESLLESLIGD